MEITLTEADIKTAIVTTLKQAGMAVTGGIDSVTLANSRGTISAVIDIPINMAAVLGGANVKTTSEPDAAPEKVTPKGVVTEPKKETPPETKTSKEEPVEDPVEELTESVTENDASDLFADTPSTGTEGSPFGDDLVEAGTDELPPSDPSEASADDIFAT